MSDLIDRQELIYSLESLPFYHQFWKPEGCEGLWESEAVVSRIKNMPSAEPLTEEDYTELRDRFGEYVEFVVRDMIDGKGERWRKVKD